MTSAPRSNITGVPGWETPAEQEYLRKMVGFVQPYGSIVEIGAEFGMSASIFCTFADPTVSIVSIDLFPDQLLHQHRENLREAGLLGRSRQLVGDSKDLCGEFPDGSIDLLFVDGDHSYNGAKADLINYSGKVAVQGIMAIHDCACTTNRMPHTLHFDVTRAVSEWFWTQQGKWQMMDSVDTMMAFMRMG